MRLALLWILPPCRSTSDRTTCLYLACKSEEQRWAASELCRRIVGPDAATNLTKAVLDLELTLLTTLQFSLFVHHPHSSLAGLLFAFNELEEKPPSQGAQQTRLKMLEVVRKQAYALLEAQYASDLVLLASPSLIALAALHRAATENLQAGTQALLSYA